MNEPLRYILKQVAKDYNFMDNKATLITLGNSSNLVYEYERNKEHFILRLSQRPKESIEYYKAEINWINYLADNGVSVSRPIRSINDNLVEVIETDNSYYIISVFEKAKGKLVDTKNRKEWNRELFHIWGQTMGQLHSLAKDFKTKNPMIKRNEWNENIYFTSEYTLPDTEQIINDKWKQIIKEMNALHKDINSYGLIHYDFHQLNFFVNNGRITVFDFEDCLLHWFTCDIAIAIYHALLNIPFNEKNKRLDFAYDFIEPFLKGYMEENQIDKCWMNQIPLFICYRRICSYKFFSKCWDLANLNEWQKEFLQWMKYNIEKDIPFIDIDFEQYIH